MVSREDVLAAYRLILGRGPESDEAVQAHTNAPSLKGLRNSFLNSVEFRATLKDANAFSGVPSPEFIDGAQPIRVDVETDNETLQRLLDRVERCWTRLEQTEPYWSGISTDQYRQENFVEHATGFYAAGEHDVTSFIAWLERNDVDWSYFETCVEIGCGTGRVTAWLARRFTRLIGCDISKSHTDLARAQAQQRNLHNIDFLHVPKIDVLDTVQNLDVLFSFVVLQHNPPPVIHSILDRIVRRVRRLG
ncbi:MAG: class I SAM-dependent methyltransferase [Ktedonobacteraceae bacterium]